MADGEGTGRARARIDVEAVGRQKHAAEVQQALIDLNEQLARSRATMAVVRKMLGNRR